MAKPKEEKSDDLEITSIGALHKGPWDKKYWSSSRGKDRYPYPVGYQALRTHNGIRYKMEIHEGPKGPLFVIISADGILCSGQTPDIAWEIFQKKGCPRLKTLHGKRLSCKIDGVEFFGFRNPFVQRLLRELVANVNGTAEQTLLSASFCNRASGAENDTRLPDSCTYPDLLPYLEKPQTTGKRSRKQKNINMKSISGSAHKRLRPRELTDNSVASSSRQRNRNAKDGLPLETVGLCDHLREEALILQEEGKLVSSENYISTRAVNIPSIEEKPLDRSKHIKVQGLGYSTPIEDNNMETIFPKSSQGFSNVDHCAPDTLDHMQDNTSAYASTAHKEGPDNVKDELTAADMTIFEGSVTESHLEGEVGTYTSNGSSERSDFDSVGQEVAKSMMTVLLPQALPLLKETSRKKKATNNHLGLSFYRAESLDENSGACPIVNVASPALVLAENSPVEMEEKVQTFRRDFDPVIPSFEHVKSVIPDSFEDDQCGHDSANGPLLFSDIAGADQASFDKDTCACDTLGQFINVDAWKESSVCHVETGERKDGFSCSKANVASKLDENSIHHGILSVEREKTLLDCAEEQSISSKMDGAEAGNQISDVAPLTRKYNGLLSESIIYRNFGDDCILDAYPTVGPLLAAEIHQVSSSASSPDKKVLFSPEVKLEGQHYNLNTEKIALNPEESCQAYIDKKLVEQQNLVKLNRSVQKGGTSFGENNMSNAEEVQAGTNLKAHIKMEVKHDLVGNTELVGCYVHPMPVLSVLLNTREDEIHICVLCGLLVDKDTILFIYKVTIKEPRLQSPTFVGYTPIILPTLKDRSGGEVALDRFGLQFTPDGQSLVLLNSIKTPYCREQKIPCLCSACKLECFEENAIKIVQIKLGFLSVVEKLKTVDSVQCILVCEPNHLVAVEESGRLHVWVMNSTWSVQTEDFIIPTYDCVSPCIVELKRIPKCAPLVVGHHGFGEFSLWDISQRILISRFAMPSISIFEFIPISLFSFQSEVPLSSNPDVDLHINKIMAATKMWFSKHNENYTFLPLGGESIAVWLLVSTLSDSDTQHDNQMNDCQTNPVGWWRLALLVKNMVILGSALDPRAAAIGASAGHGIIGTHDGLVYMWELSTGTKLGSLHYFKGGVSCIATDDSRSDVFAVAGDGGQLLVYLHPQKES
ncbi:uncharacterized protein LOC100268093 isoform X3 [Vitis vinifera]|uniref:uncharacterized protein LOC100268093 isoform X3 n=1 Tax=Vitis vinifera TaxID=29760 RepID=UPI0008FEB8E2|nr:uncharacterized protein LOC100268093 isoform X3 [Vitis vinifera]|eukprot:XP_019074824.1 PREDICTED: uncharacterized protein LOC100268093 isoform X4 [Vitis vinifera]